MLKGRAITQRQEVKVLMSVALLVFAHFVDKQLREPMQRLLCSTQTQEGKCLSVMHKWPNSYSFVIII